MGFPRSVVTGVDFIYMGKTLGNIKVEVTKVKGCPRAWVDAAVKQRKNLEEVGSMVFNLAYQEGKLYDFEPGKKMGNKMFWRNALGYTNSLLRKAGKTAIKKEEVADGES